MRSELRPALLLLLVLTLITGVVYPLGVTGLAQLAFPHQAHGSLLLREGNVVGSSLIGQPFSDARYFWGRLSATSPEYNAAGSVGSNLGPLHPDLVAHAKARLDALREADSTAAPRVPVDLVTASGSGLDPHISVAAAEYQVARVARERGLDPEVVRKLVREHTESPVLHLVGEPAVNVLELNLALDALAR